MEYHEHARQSILSTHIKQTFKDRAQEAKLFFRVKASFSVKDVLRITERQLETQKLHTSFPRNCRWIHCLIKPWTTQDLYMTNNNQITKHSSDLNGKLHKSFVDIYTSNSTSGLSDNPASNGSSFTYSRASSYEKTQLQ
jgi:hypothetical protein